MTLKSIIRKGKHTIISKKFLESHLKAQLQQQSKIAHYTISTNVRAISGCRKKKKLGQQEAMILLWFLTSQNCTQSAKWKYVFIE